MVSKLPGVLVVAAVAAAAAGLRVFDAAVGGLGGCPYIHTSLAV